MLYGVPLRESGRNRIRSGVDSRVQVGMPRVFDCFPFFNELDVLEVRLSELDSLVDRFVIVEATRTHTGQPKPLYFADSRRRFDRFTDKIIHVVVDDLPTNTADHWVRENFQREAIMRGLGEARPDDRIIISDCDEIPKPPLLRQALALHGMSRRIIAFWCENFIYRFNVRNDGHDHRLGPRLLTKGSLKSPQVVRDIPFRFSKRSSLKPLTGPMACLRVLDRMGRVLWPTIYWKGAWHFSNMGDVDAVNYKFASFAHAGELPPVPESRYRREIETFEKCAISELPQSLRSERFAHLLA